MAVIEAKNITFDGLVKEGTVVVDFNADWCGPCQMMKPIYEMVAKDTDGIKFLSVNIDNESEIADKFGVSGIPTFVLFKDGKEVARETGVLPEKKLRKFLEQ